MADLGDIVIGLQVDDSDVVKSLKSFDRMKSQIAQVMLAERKGEITKKQYNRAIQQMGIAFGKVTGDINSAKSAIQKYAYAIKDATDDQLRFQAASGKGMRRLEILAQQAGYQVGDLAVQIQSGTNAMVALGQQGSQLLGFFGPTGALAGAALAITTAIIAPIMKAKEEAADLEKAFEGVSDALEAIDDLKVGEDLKGGLLKVAQDIRGEFEASLALVKKIAAETLKAELEKPLAAMREEYRKYVSMSTMSRDPVEFNMMGFTDEQNFIDAYKLISQISGDTREEIAKSVDATIFWLRGSGLLTKEVEKLLAGYVDAAGTVDLINKKTDDGVDAQLDFQQAMQASMDDIEKGQAARDKRQQEYLNAMGAMMDDIAKGQADRAKEEAKILAIYNEQKQLLGDEVALQTMIKQFGEESLAIGRLKREIELDQYEVELRRQGLNEQMITQLVEQKRVATGLKLEMQEMAALAQTTLNFAPTTQVARAMAKYASRGTVSDKKPIYGSGPLAGKSLDYEPPKGPESGESKFRKYLEAQQRELDFKIKSVKMTDDQIARAEYEFEVKEQAIQYGVKASDEQLKAVMKLYDASVQLEKKAELVNGISDAFSQTLMDVSTGADNIRDAFQKLMFDIAKMVYQQAIIDPAVDALKSALFQANGGVHSRGNVVPFANGGVVNGPTLFRMSGGTGLMGEAGPEAIMPLKRGKDGKLGVAGGSTTVVQNFNFSANGDESVKRIIAQEAPKIADMTQASIMDSRRRGGSMRKAFG